MIVLEIADFDLPPGVTHLASQWEVADDLAFTNILVSSGDDYASKLSKVFNMALDFNNTYYGRVRLLTGNGYTKWFNIDVFVASDSVDPEETLSLPAYISPPDITITTDADNPNGNVTRGYFTLDIGPMITIGTATHESTTWQVRSLSGEWLMNAIDDTVNLTSIDVPVLSIANGKQIVIDVLYTNSIGVQSTPTRKIVTVYDEYRIEMLSSPNEYNYNTADINGFLIDVRLRRGYPPYDIIRPIAGSSEYNLFTITILDKDNNVIHDGPVDAIKGDKDVLAPGDILLRVPEDKLGFDSTYTVTIKYDGNGPGNTYLLYWETGFPYVLGSTPLGNG